MITKGQKINNRYEILKSIGEGGMANVYLAHDVILDRNVAIKVLRGDLAGDEKFVRRFQREALSASGLSHPNIVEMYDVGEDDGTYYIVMEYIEGKTLKQLIKKRGKLTLSESIDIMLQLTDGIDHAHASYIIHRDIKPQNIMIQGNGEIKITDFGIAIALNNTQLTQTNSVMGSVHYLPPEQASGKTPTVKSDIYSMGILFYELLTGQLPFKGDNAVEIAFKHIKNDIPSIREIDNTIPQSIENIVLKATAKNPKNRYASAKEMHDDILTALSEERSNEEKITFKYPEHEGDAEKADLMLDDQEVKVKKKKEEVDEPEESNTTNVILWIMAGLFILIIIVLLIIFIIGPKLGEVPDVKIPDVTQMTVIEAESALKKVGFDVATEIQYIGDDNVEKGLVVKTSPSAGRMVKEGTKITLYESTGKVAYVIENYVGRNYIEVETILKNNYGLNVVIDKMEVDDEDDIEDEQVIIKQDLAVGTEVAKGDNITLYIPDIIVKYPDFTDGTWSKSDIESFCKKYGINVEFKYKEKAGFQQGAIISQSRASGTAVTKGVTITVTVANAPTGAQEGNSEEDQSIYD